MDRTSAITGCIVYRDTRVLQGSVATALSRHMTANDRNRISKDAKQATRAGRIFRFFWVVFFQVANDGCGVGGVFFCFLVRVRLTGRFADFGGFIYLRGKLRFGFVAVSVLASGRFLLFRLQVICCSFRRRAIRLHFKRQVDAFLLSEVLYNGRRR